jgi:transcriptional regulator with XRE-family HTH domain
MMTTDTTIGGRLRRARLNVGLSQPQAAEKMGLTQTTLSRHENNHGDPKLSTLRKYAELYRVMVRDLI